MKISELIELLARALREHGDIEVMKGCGDQMLPIVGAEAVPSKSKPIRL